MLAGTAAIAGALSSPAGASSSVLGVPSGVHVVSATPTSLTVGLHAAANAQRYRLYVSSVKSDLYVRNMTHHSKRRRSAIAASPRIHLAGLRYTTKPYYYRVAAVDGSDDQWSATYQTAYLRPKTPTALHAVSTTSGTYLTWRSAAVTASSVEQSTDSTFRSNVRTYHLRGPSTMFTPVGLVAGVTYYFRVRGVNPGTASPPSQPVATTVAANESPVRVLSYNSLDASFDGQEHPGGRAAPFSQRRAGQLSLLERSHADVIGIQEANACLRRYRSKPCYRQIDSLAAGLRGHYRLDGTEARASGPDRYIGNYILYDPSVLRPSGAGGDWKIGPRGDTRYAVYQVFRSVRTGASFLFVNTHLIATAGSRWDVVRGAETEQMLSKATAFAARRGITSVVYVGDFNSYPNEYRVHDVTGSDMLAAGVTDDIEAAETRRDARFDSINGYYRVARKGHGSADHIYTGPGIGVRSWRELLHLSRGRFVGTIPSDHNPVLASIEIPY